MTKKVYASAKVNGCTLKVYEFYNAHGLFTGAELHYKTQFGSKVLFSSIALQPCLNVFCAKVYSLVNF